MTRAYSDRELQADRIIHFLGLALGGVGATVIVTATVLRNGDNGLVAVLVYAFGLLAMLGFSAAYNLARTAPHRELLRRLDHAAIFLMIAGTYTPFIDRGAFGARSGWFGTAIWGAALAGVSVKFFQPRRLESVAVVLYLLLGWIGAVEIRSLLATLDRTTICLLGGGGLLYSAGSGVHLWRRLPFQNAIWHAFVLVAAACHYAAILWGVVFVGS